MSNTSNGWLNDATKVSIARQAHEDLDWAMAHFTELDEQYHGEYVAVWKKQVIAHSFDLDGLLQESATPEHPREQLAIVEFPEFSEAPH